MPELPLLRPVTMLLLAGIVAVTLARRLGLTPIVGYFIAGALIGPHALHLVPESPTVHFLAELGVVFLLFDIGLHFSLKELWETRNQLFGMGPLQVGLSLVLVGGVAYLAGLPASAALVVGATLAMSSTAVVLQNLLETEQQDTPLGRYATAILIFQDFFAVFLLVLVGSLGSAGASLAATLGTAGLKAVLAIAAVAILGRFLRPAFAWVTRSGSEEAFTATTLLLVLATAGATGLAGLSLPLGAFLAGMLLSESEYCYMVKTELKPFRGLLLGLFFITVGMSLELEVIAGSLGWVLAIVAGLLIGKTLALFLAARGLGMCNGFSIRLGLLLAQVSEFAFVILGLAVSQGLLSLDTASLLSAAAVLSMALTPALTPLGERLAGWLEARRATTECSLPPVPDASEAAQMLPGRVLIDGIGEPGRTVARALHALGMDYMALESDPRKLAEGRVDGFQVAYGSAEQLSLVEAAGVAQAQGLVLNRVEPDPALNLVRQLRSRYPALKVLLRTEDNDAAQAFREAGATVWTAGADALDATALAAETLRVFGVAEERIQRWLTEFVEDPHWEKADKAHAL